MSDEPSVTPIEDEDVQEETVDGVPVLAAAAPPERSGAPSLPTVQAAAVAATGFIAGAATMALVRRRSARKLARARAANGGRRRSVAALPVVASRTFLIDVHVLGKPGE
jgi:hypothetical protein